MRNHLQRKHFLAKELSNVQCPTIYWCTRTKELAWHWRFFIQLVSKTHSCILMHSANSRPQQSATDTGHWKVIPDQMQMWNISTNTGNVDVKRDFEKRGFAQMPTVQFQATVTGDHFPNTVTPGAAHPRCRLHRATQSYTELHRELHRATQRYTKLHSTTQSYTELHRATQRATQSHRPTHQKSLKWSTHRSWPTNSTRHEHWAFRYSSKCQGSLL